MTPDWTETAPGGSPLIDAAGKAWTVINTNAVLRDGVQAFNWRGTRLMCKWPTLYIEGQMGGAAYWFAGNTDTGELMGVGSKPSASDPATQPGGPPPPPPPEAPPAPTPAPSPTPAPPPLNVDADIAAADQLTLQKLQFQHNRNRSVKEDAHKAWVKQLEDARLAGQTAVLTDTEAGTRRDWAMAAFDKAVTASTPAAIATWVNGSMARRDAIVAECMRRYP